MPELKYTRKNLSGLLIADIAAMTVLYLLPDGWGDWQIKKILLILMAVAAAVLLFLLSGKKEKEGHAQITKIDCVSQMNPNQYLSKGGPVCAGSDGRYHVTFLLKDDTRLVLSLSGKQAGTLAVGMCGTLIHNGSVFLSFTPDYERP